MPPLTATSFQAFTVDSVHPLAAATCCHHQFIKLCVGSKILSLWFCNMVCFFVCLCVGLCVCLFVWLFVCCFVCLFVCLFICLFVCLFDCLFVCFFCLCVFFVCLFGWLFVCLFVCLPVYLPTCFTYMFSTLVFTRWRRLRVPLRVFILQNIL